MFAAAAFTQATAIDVTFELPSHRSSGPARRQRTGQGIFASLARPIRRAFANAADEVTTPWLPRLINYPY